MGSKLHLFKHGDVFLGLTSCKNGDGMGVEATKVAMFCGCLRYNNVDFTMISPAQKCWYHGDIVNKR